MNMVKIKSWLEFPPAALAGVIFLSLILNFSANITVPLLNGLLFLDMLGTALAALALGPWWAATIGVLTNVLLANIPGHEQYFNYTIVNVSGALLWGYLDRTWIRVFPAHNTNRRLLARITLLGLFCGLLSSI